MKGVDKKLFPEDRDWLKGAYNDLHEAFGSFEYFAKYIRKRFPNSKDSEIESFRSAFLIEYAEVIWKPITELQHRRTYLAWGSSTIQVLLPDDPKLTHEEKMRIEDEIHERYMSRIKESHIRLNALLWYLISDEKKTELRQYFPDEIDPKDLGMVTQKRK